MASVRSNIIAAATFLSGVAAINNGLAITPNMGWVRASKHLCPSNVTDDIRTTGMPLVAMYQKIYS
jgi:hypothetical protein